MAAKMAANTVAVDPNPGALARPAKADERPSKSATEGAKGDAVSVQICRKICGLGCVTRALVHA